MGNPLSSRPVQPTRSQKKSCTPVFPIKEL
jgi:hypothetical protein